MVFEIVANGIQAQEWMDGWREGRKNVVAIPIIFNELWWWRGSGWDEDGPTSEFEGIQKTNMAGVTHHMLTRPTRHLQAK